FAGDRAIGGSPGASAAGGAISLDPDLASLLGNSGAITATLTVTDCTIEDSAALGAPGGDNANTFGYGQGGGINSFATTNLTVRRSTLTGNRAQGAPLAA